MRAGKIIAHHRHGQGKIAARALTVLRSGPLGDNGAGTAGNMFVDVSPHLSLKGLDIERQYDRRGNTMRDGDESHIQSRTRGKHSPMQHDGRSHHNLGNVKNIVAKGQFGNGGK